MEVRNYSEATYQADLIAKFGVAYSEEELLKNYKVESCAFGAVLCSDKDEQLRTFNHVVSPDGKVYFIPLIM